MMSIFAIIIVSAIAVICLIMFYYRLKDNNQSPLSIKTFDGSNSPYHPSVKYKENGFSGYQYIMSETPFYLSLPSIGDNYRDQFECPCIHYSHDGVHWIDLVKNPLDSLTKEEIDNRDYFSDPDLVETPNGLECWYRLNRRHGKETNQEHVLLLRKSTSDGLSWGNREIIADLHTAHPEAGLGRIVISPSILYEDNKYKCWFVDSIHLNKERLCYSESFDAKTWTNKKIVSLNGPKITPWHLHILRDEDVLWLTIYDHKNVSLWKGTSECEFVFDKMLLTPSKAFGSFYSNNTYRSCLIKLPNSRYRLYFSADDMFKSYIGIMEGDTPETMSIVSVDNGIHSSLLDGLKIMFRTYNKHISYKMRYYSMRLVPKTKEIFKRYVAS